MTATKKAAAKPAKKTTAKRSPAKKASSKPRKSAASKAKEQEAEHQGVQVREGVAVESPQSKADLGVGVLHSPSNAALNPLFND